MKAFADHFSRVAAEYSAYRPRYPDGLFAALAAAVPRRGLAWDCATGTGQAAVGLAACFHRVLASDASLSQLRQAAGSGAVAYVVADAGASPIRSGSADLVTVAQALHWLDLDRFYAEARRSLAPGGLVAVWTYGRHRVDGGPIDGLIDRFYRDVVGPYWAPERRWVEVGYRGLPFPFREESIAVPPMVEEWTLRQMLGYLSTWSAVVRCIETTGANPIHALGDQLAPLWDGDRRRRLEWSLTLRAGR
ncbi:MAG: class I SAM-dependent methyltransferase [Gemmatimonadales bacterium]|nr:class I SAM-dependent methyltransferase [Gemmatimonadales bacterium]